MNQEPWGSGPPSPQLSTSPSVPPQPSSPSSPPRVGALAARWHCDLAERRPRTRSRLERRPPLPRGRAARAMRAAPLAGLPTACPASPCCPAQPRPSSCLSHKNWGVKIKPLGASPWGRIPVGAGPSSFPGPPVLPAGAGMLQLEVIRKVSGLRPFKLRGWGSGYQFLYKPSV